MPTYEYKREDGSVFEILQGINDKALETCPDTGQKVKRIISGGGGVIYKGTGFYITDYKNGNSNGSNESKRTNESSEANESSGANKSAGSNEPKKEAADKPAKGS